MSESIVIKNIRAEDTYGIRHQVLRPNQTLNDCEYPDDFNTDSIHLGAFFGKKLVGVASFYKENYPEFQVDHQYRLRGMATLPEYRGMQAGKQLIDEAESLLKERSADLWWCNARTTASGFYEKIGLSVHGDIFEIVPIGPHKLMFRKLRG